MISSKEQAYIQCTVKELVDLRKQFTGEDVLKRLNSKFVRGRSEKYSCQATAAEVSTFVRKLFNLGDVVFIGSYYGSAPMHVVSVTKGPLLYFPLPHHAKALLLGINKKLTHN